MVAVDWMINNIHERELSKQDTVKVKNFRDTATETILEKLENLLDSKLDMLIVQIKTNEEMEPRKFLM